MDSINKMFNKFQGKSQSNDNKTNVSQSNLKTSDKTKETEKKPVSKDKNKLIRDNVKLIMKDHTPITAKAKESASKEKTIERKPLQSAALAKPVRSISTHKKPEGSVADKKVVQSVEKKPFVPKANFLVNNSLKFNKTENKKETSVFKKTERTQTSSLQKSQNNLTKPIVKSKETKSIVKSKEIPKVKEIKPKLKGNNNGNFVRLNMKKKYQEKKLNKAPNLRRVKLEKRKVLLNEKIRAKKEEEDLIILEIDQKDQKTEKVEENNKTEEIKDLINMEESNNQICFSEGFIKNELIRSSTKKTSSSSKKDKHELTPNLFTRKLNTVVKTSLAKQVPFDTELRLLSKEFKEILSGKKEIVQKQLNFEEKRDNETKKELKYESEPEMMDEVEIEGLENEILSKVLEENFPYKSFLNGQLDIIKSVLNRKNTLGVLPSGSGKSLCYQLPSLVQEGITIVVTPFVTQINKNISKLPPCLSGACLTALTTPTQRKEIVDAIKEEKIKIIFMTPERLALENMLDFHNVSLICYEDASLCCPLSNNFRSSYINLDKILKELPNSPILLLSNPISSSIQRYLENYYNIENVFRQEVKMRKGLSFSFSKDSNKIQALVKLLRSPERKNMNSIVIYCNLKKTVDRVTSYLNQSGLTAISYHSGRSEAERHQIQQNFNNDKIKIVVSTHSFSSGITKFNVNLKVIFEMPSTLEQFLNLFSNSNQNDSNTQIHTFVEDEDYFILRNIIYSDNIDRVHLSKLIDYMLVKSKTGMKRKINEIDNELGKDLEYPRKYAINLSNIQENIGIKKNVALYLLISLFNHNEKAETNNKIKNLNVDILGVGPFSIHIKFYKSTPQILSEKNETFKQIYDISRKNQGSISFNTLEMCEKLKMDHLELLNVLYTLQHEGEISFESKDDSIFVLIHNELDSIVEVLQYLNNKLKEYLNYNLRKLNTAYIFFRKYSSNNVDSFIGSQTTIKCLKTYESYNDYNEAIINDIVKYFSTDEEVTMAGNYEEYQIILPIQTIDTQRDKTNISKEIEEELKNKLKSNPLTTNTEIMHILFGVVHSEHKSNQNFSNPHWSKYRHYDYDAIYEIVDGLMSKLKSSLDLNSKQLIKKIKK